MNSIFLFVFLFANISALNIPEENLKPTETRDARLISNAIVNAIQGVSHAIKDSGYDPIYIEKKNLEISLPIPVIFNAEACFEEILIGGFSNIVIHNINYNIFRSCLEFDIELPLIYVYGTHTLKATLLGKEFDVIASGNIAIHRSRCVGQIYFNIISGTISSVTINSSLEGITSNIQLISQGKNFSNYMNYFIGTTLPSAITAYKSHVDELLAIILIKFIDGKF